MNGETWAQVSLRVVSRSLTIQEIEQLMGTASSGRRGDLWVTELTADSATELSEQIAIAKDYLRRKVAVMGEDA